MDGVDMWRTPSSILSIRSVTIHHGWGELGRELLDGTRKAGVLEGRALDLSDRVEDRGVVATVEGLGDLARSADGRGAIRGEDRLDGEPELGGNRLLDLASVGARGGGGDDGLGGQGVVDRRRGRICCGGVISPAGNLGRDC